MNGFLYLIFGFLTTLITELIVYFMFIKGKKLNIFLYCLLINSFTWPLANLIYAYINLFLLIELGVFLIELILIKILFSVGWKKAILISLVANILTTTLSFII